MTTTDKPTRILVVDDNRDAADSLGHVLTAVGYQVATCYDGQEALATAERFEPDACVLDLNMPGMDGCELGRRLRSRTTSHRPVLAMLTANRDIDALIRADEAGFDLYFSKPADPSELARRLDRCVRE